MLHTNWNSAPFRVCHRTLSTQLFPIPDAFRHGGICFFQSPISSWGIGLRLRLAYLGLGPQLDLTSSTSVRCE